MSANEGRNWFGFCMWISYKNQQVAVRGSMNGTWAEPGRAGVWLGLRELELWACPKEKAEADGRQTLDSLPRLTRTHSSQKKVAYLSGYVCVCGATLKREKIAIRRFLCLAKEIQLQPKPNCAGKTIFPQTFFLIFFLYSCCSFFVVARRVEGSGWWVLGGGWWPLPHGRLLRYNSLILLRPCPSPTSLSQSLFLRVCLWWSVCVSESKDPASV